ncbi:MAG: 5'-nucleotidase C-terminal domain-containing protein [Deltaproteobacteria bacterium]|jgi:hypothetical protein|nr:5'-nucleotidase C-terminal domain-containing protein [Deltaproteobacteria bacterium]
MTSEPLTIIVTSDIHAQIAPGPGRPGLARLAAYVREKRRQGEVLLADCGDLFSGSVYGGFDQGRTLADLLNRLGWGVLVPGNHDFDYSPETGDPFYYFRTLLPRLQPRPQVLGLNLACPRELDIIRGPFIVRPDPPRTVLIGVVCPLTSRPSLGGILKDFDFGLRPTLAQTAREIKDSLRRCLKTLQPSDRVIVLAHLGTKPASPGLAAQLNLDFSEALTGPDLAELPVSLVCDGHSHQVAEPASPFGGALYTNLGCGLAAAAEITLAPDSWDVRLIRADELAALDPDPILDAEIAALEERLGLREVLLTLPPGAECSLEGLWETITPLGQLAAEAMAERAGTQTAFLNKGALRAGLAGRVTAGSLHEVLPFNDRLLSVSFSGETIFNMLARCGQKGFRGFPLYHGLTLFASPGEGNEHTRQTVDLAGIRINGRKLEMGKYYSAALSGQMARLLAKSGLPLEKIESCGGLLEALLDLVRRRAASPLLTPPVNPYCFFENRPAALEAFEKS